MEPLVGYRDYCAKSKGRKGRPSLSSVRRPSWRDNKNYDVEISVFAAVQVQGSGSSLAPKEALVDSIVLSFLVKIFCVACPYIFYGSAS